MTDMVKAYEWQAARNEARERILELLIKTAQPLSWKEISKALSLTESMTRNTLYAMQRSQLVVRHESYSGNKLQHVYWGLP